MKQLGIFPLVFFLYAWLFPWLPELRSPNELSRYYQTRAMVEHGSIAVNEVMAKSGPVGDLSVKDGRYFPNKAPGVSLLGVPVYAALRHFSGGDVPERAAIFFLRLFTTILPGAIAAELMRRLLAARFSPPVAEAGALVFALGSLMWPYSTLLMSHGPTAVALLAAWYAISQEGKILSLGIETRHVLAGSFAGVAVMFEYTSALMIPPLAVYALYKAEDKGRAAAAGAIGLVGPLAALALYHWAAFGNPFHTGYRYLVNQTFAEWHSRGFMGVGAPSLRALVGSFFDPGRGLFAYAPFLALGFVGLPTLWRRDKADAALCASAALLYMLFTAGFVYEAWGWSVGPRHITPLCVFLTLPACALADRLRQQGLGVVPATLTLYSMIACAAAVAICPYFPEELTHPLSQLVFPLAAASFHANNPMSFLLGWQGIGTLLPWFSVLAPTIWRAGSAWLSQATLVERHKSLASCAAAVMVIYLALAFTRTDRFEATRKFMTERFEPRPGFVPRLFGDYRPPSQKH